MKRPGPFGVLIGIFIAWILIIAILKGTEPAKPVYSCKATQTALPDHTQWWHVRTTEDGQHWTLYSIRGGSEIKKALNDCAAWLKSKQPKSGKR